MLPGIVSVTARTHDDWVEFSDPRVLTTATELTPVVK